MRTNARQEPASSRGDDVALPAAPRLTAAATLTTGQANGAIFAPTAYRTASGPACQTLRRTAADSKGVGER